MSKTSIAIIAFLLFSCGDNGKKERPASPRIKKETKVIGPKQNQKFFEGQPVPFEFEAKNAVIDSVQVELNGNKTIYTGTKFEVTLTSKKVGIRRIKSTVYFGGKKETHYSKVIVLPTQSPTEYTYEIVNTYPHNTEDYTQGLLISEGFLYESTGQNGSSSLLKKNIESGEVLQQLNLSDDFFGEGLAYVNDQFYLLTYHAETCFVYDKSFERVNSFPYEGEGWGLTEFDGNLLMTNSTNKIIVREPATFTIIDELEAYDPDGKVDAINELEVINGLVYANVYQEDYIVVIDPETGAVVQKIDMSGLLTAGEKNSADVLNGIAYDEQNDRIFVTGKLWPKLFEVKFTPKNEVQ